MNRECPFCKQTDKAVCVSDHSELIDCYGEEIKPFIEDFEDCYFIVCDAPKVAVVEAAVRTQRLQRKRGKTGIG